MKKFIAAFLAALLLAPITSANPEIIKGMLDQMRQSIEAECADEKELSCMGVSASQCVEIKQDVFDTCTEPALSGITEFTQEQMGAAQADNISCTIERVSEKHGIDLEQFVSCVGADRVDEDALKSIED